jgi:threonine dehydrogenase-like Zn-dependent dehydrogenase
MAVGLHAVNKARLQPADSAYVVGCGPVGLAVIAALRLSDVRPVVAADYSPRRRELALLMGADAVIDPAAGQDPERWRIATVVFECVGVPGVIAHIMEAAPRGARIVVVGVCMEPDTIHPLRGISKELSLHFVLGYDGAEFATTLRHIAEGMMPTAPLITGTVGLDGVAGAFEELASPERHAKILVTPNEPGAV